MNTEHVNCDLCECNDTELWGHKDSLNIVRCKKCGLVYTNPRLTSEELKKYYSAEYFSKGDYDGDPLRKKMYLIEIETQIKKIVGIHGRFLDVGCAYGVFLNTLPNSFEKYGVEFSKEAAEYGKREFNLNIQIGGVKDCKFPNSFFDVVHLRGVIEHLQSPKGDLKILNRLLKPEGWLIISTTPNLTSPAARIFREKYKLVSPKEHIYNFSVKTLSELLKKTDFQIKKIYYPYLNTPYANLFKDIKNFFLNQILNKESPPFFHSVMTIYAKKSND